MLQESADIITDWSRHNDMRRPINATNTKEMIIRFCRNDNHVESIPRIVIDDNDIERVTQAKVLGVTLSEHVDTIVSKDRKRVFTIYQLKRADIRQCDLLRVYVSVIRPVLEYACPVWHRPYKPSRVFIRQHRNYSKEVSPNNISWAQL